MTNSARKRQLIGLPFHRIWNVFVQTKNGDQLEAGTSLANSNSNDAMIDVLSNAKRSKYHACVGDLGARLNNLRHPPH